MVLFLVAAVVATTAGLLPAAETPLRQEAYIWQRAWTGPVTNAIATLSTNFDTLVALQAEVSWSEGMPRCARADLDYAVLRSLDRPVGLALRIGRFGGPFTPGDPHTVYLAALSRTLVAEARAQHLHPAELQLDFDCAAAKLDGYRVWLKAIAEAVKPVPVSLTALPSWLGHSEFKALAEQASGFVLQVHSFERPSSADASPTLCDPRLARRAVQTASTLGVPFRVALPTYGYLAGFTAEGQFLGLSAEGPARDWPGTTRVIEVRADPAALSGLVRQWVQDRPAHLEGLIWYRLPMPDDVLNWGWPTLRSVMAGLAPAAHVQADVRWVRPELAEFDLFNEGTAEASLPTMTVRWLPKDEAHGGAIEPAALATDGLRGYQVVPAGPHSIRYKPPPSDDRLKPGERVQVGWVRFDVRPELILELHETHD